MAGLQFTHIDEIPKIRDELRATFRARTTRPLAWRRHQILQLARLAQDNAEALASALAVDLGRPRFETFLTETGAVVERSLTAAARLEEWAKPQVVDVPEWQQSWTPTIHKAPLGVALIICPWNYPIILTLQPLLGAISAGNCAVLKPSELAPTYATLIAELLPKYLDQSAYRVVNGAVEVTTKLLDLQWDHIFYTGNGRVARIIAAAAAKHLTPMTLELGGKSPVVVDPTYDLDLAARRILYGKINNAGQICVSPDYVLIPRDKQDAFIAALKKQLAEFFPQGALQSDSFSRIVSDAHHARLKRLLGSTQGEIVFGGATDDKRGFEVTIVRDVKDGDALLGEEIFGPILPIVPVDSIDEALAIINDRDHSLVLYAFSEDAAFKEKVREETTSGNLAFNDTFQQLSVGELPFGGVGESGYGRQFLHHSFDGMSYQRATVDVPKAAEALFAPRYPPYTDDKFRAIATAVDLPIPPSDVGKANGHA